MDNDADKIASAATVAAVGTFELGGRTFLLGAPSLSDNMAWRAEIKRQMVRQAKDPLKVLNEKVQAAAEAGHPYNPVLLNALVASAMSAAQRPTGRVEPTQEEINAGLEEIDSMRWWTWVQIRKADPTVTLKQVTDWIPDEFAKYDVMEKLLPIAQLQGLDPNAPRPAIG